ncbi:MAG: hypothetical protein HC889_06675 [Synechococcaceae cyanobacterium SM1_2_3]|nr:hypothetical protein [Synechococcaceae cyanobacterium SM1_2_3]
MNPKRLLIVDDEPAFGEFVRQVALALDYEVTVTKTVMRFSSVIPAFSRR